MNGMPDGEIEGQALASVPSSADASDGLPSLVGRIRRLHRQKEWGLVYAELPSYSSDIFFEATEAEDISTLEQGDFVIFDYARDEYDQSFARKVRKATPEEVDRQQELLVPVFEQYRSSRLSQDALAAADMGLLGGSNAASNRVAELPSGGTAASADADATGSMMLQQGVASGHDVSGNPLAQSAMANAAMANAAIAGASSRGHQMLHHDVSAPPAMMPSTLESALLPPPPQLPPPPVHPAPGGSGEPFHYLPAAQQAYAGYAPNYGQDMHQQMYHQGMNQWPANDAGSNQMNPMISVAEHTDQVVKILKEPLPVLQDLNPKDIVNRLSGHPGSQRTGRKLTSSVNGFGMTLGREFAEILRQASEMHSQTEHADAQDQENWANQWHWWAAPQTQGDAQMQANHVYHGAVQHGGHGVLATPGDHNSMYTGPSVN